MEKKLVYGSKHFDPNDLKYPTHKITSININNESQMVSFVVERGIDTKQKTMTMEYAQKIGFINIDALKDYV